MELRERYHRALNELRDEILLMGSRVENEMKLALEALEKLDTDLARAVYEEDLVVNQARFDIEEQCFKLIVTQQPAASDLRVIVAAMNIIVDLERMGDQAKGIAKLIPHLKQYLELRRPPELQQMGAMVLQMANQAMIAYADGDVALARSVAAQDDRVDALYAQIFTHIMFEMARTDDPEQIETIYDLLRASRELERYGDLAVNIADRIVYLVTGTLEETNVDDSLLTA